MTRTQTEMNLRARLFVAFMVVAGCTLLGAELGHWHSARPIQFACYCVLAVAACRVKIGLAGGAAIPAFFVFIFLGILDWSLSETLALACAATLAQSYWHTSQSPTWSARLRPMLFNMSNIALASATMFYAYRAVIPASAQGQPTLLTAVFALAAASLIFFAMNTFPVAAVVALRDDSSLRMFWKDCYVWSLPYYLASAAIAGLVAFLERLIGWQAALLILPLLYLVHWSSWYLHTLKSEKAHAEETAALHLRTVQVLSLAIGAKDGAAHNQLKRVPVYAVEIGREMGLAKSDLEALRAASVLHDIGQLAVPEHIISKPGNLTREELEKLKIHPAVGAEILERVRFPYPVTPIVRSHHEKWNGSGYPDGLRGEQIPIGARILAAVECLDTLASDRQYRRGLPLEEALRRVAAEAGSSFDPKVVEVLQRRCQYFEQIARDQEPELARPAGPSRARHAEPNRANFEEPPSVAPECSLTSAVDLASGLGMVPNRPGGCLTHIAAARQEEQDLFELSQDIGSSLSLNETLSLLAIRLKRIVPHDALAIYVPRDAVLKPEYVSGDNFRLFSALEIPLGQGLSGWVAENRKPILNGNPAFEPGYVDDETRFTPMRSALSVPLAGVGGVASVLTLYHSGREAFTRDHQRILMVIAPKVGHAIDNALKYEQAESSASTDYMTGLPNARSLFLHLDGELARCRRTVSPVIVLVCDMNGFKGVNDRFGHLEGNRLLRATAEKIKDCCREYDYVARMGGDEFVLVLPGLRMDQAKSTMQRLNDVTQEAGREVCGIDTISLSIGAAMYPDDGAEAEHLLSEADRHMYLEKQKQKLRLVEPRGFDFDPVATM